MTREQAKALAPVIAGYAEGKVVQWWSEEQGRWKDFTKDEEPNLFNLYDQYRCKPAPRTVWVNIYSDGRMGQPYRTREEAERVAGDLEHVAVEFVEAEGGA